MCAQVFQPNISMSVNIGLKFQYWIQVLAIKTKIDLNSWLYVDIHFRYDVITLQT